MQHEQSISVEPKKREQISIVIDAQTRERLEAAAVAEHRTLSAQVRHVLALALEPKRDSLKERNR